MCKKILTFTSLFLPLAVFHISCLHAEVYKWTDAEGNVFYGDKPVSENAERVKIKKAPKHDPDYQKRIDKREKLLDVMQEEREEKLAEEEQTAQKKEKQEQECRRIIAELESMRSASALYEETDDPFNPKIVSEEKRLEEQEKYQRYIDENC